VRHTSFADMHCSLARGLELVGDWWSPLILRDLFLGITHFDELVEDLGISRNLLAARLKALVKGGIVARRLYQERPARYVYELAEAGRDLAPVLLALTGGIDAAIAALLLYVLIQQVENNVLVPKIQGDAVELHPSVVMLALVVGGSIAGLLGAILALPVTAAARDIFRYAFHRLDDPPKTPEEAVAIIRAHPEVVEEFAPQADSPGSGGSAEAGAGA
jgi:DNA-binding HxlR family transcriptional regulator